MESELGSTSGADLDLMLDELGLTNLLEDNRRSDMDPTDAIFASPALHARGHSSPNQNNEFTSDSNSNDIAELTLR